MRILITGSRDWTDSDVIRNALASFTLDTSEEITVVHGDCPTGADSIAAKIASENGFNVEAHPADWARHGKSAGPIRNQEMVDLGADICLAFPKGDSRGTRGCMKFAKAAGIKVVNYGD